jgi:hypothetical protein
MGRRRNQKLITAATRLMEPGERVELTTLAKLGSAPAAAAATVAASMAAGVVVSLLGGGVGFVGFARRAVYIVLTDRQVMFFEAVQSTGGPGKHLASFRRHLVTSSEPKGSVLGLKLRIGVDGMNQPLALTFPPLPPSLRGQGRELAGALPRP